MAGLLAVAILLSSILITTTAVAPPGRASSYDDTDPQDPPTSETVLPPRCLHGGRTMPARPGVCRVTSYGADRPAVVLWGDSHAWQQLPALHAEADRTRTNLLVLVMGACPPMDLRGQGYRGYCSKQAELALDVISRRRAYGGVKVVLGAFWELYQDLNSRARAGIEPQSRNEQFLFDRAEMFAAGGRRLFRTLGAWDVPTAAIGQVPWVSDEAPPCEAGEAPYSCDLSRSIAFHHESVTRDWVQKQLLGVPRAAYVDTTGFLCDDVTCHAELDGAPVFLDDLHLNPAITGAFAPAYTGIFGPTPD